MVLRLIGFEVPSRFLEKLLFHCCPIRISSSLILLTSVKSSLPKHIHIFWGIGHGHTWGLIMCGVSLLLISLGDYKEKRMTRPNVFGFPLTHRDVFPCNTP